MKTFKHIRLINNWWMGMNKDASRLIHSLESREINALLNLYYNRNGISKGFNESDFEKKTIHSLTEKNLILTSLIAGESIVSLTDDGLDICGSVMFEKINEKKDLFKELIQIIPERAVACLVNRVMWKEKVEKESGIVDPTIEPYALDENLWYERILLKDGRIIDTLEKLYNVLEGLDFIKTVDDERWCLPEVEDFLKDEYREIMDLTWTEEDSLKYYFFFYAYAQDQRNLINFSGDGEEYRSMFFDEGSSLPEYWFSQNSSDPHILSTSLGISEKRIIEFLNEMQRNEIVTERYYPNSYSFSNDDKIFVITDIKGYMDYINEKLLSPVVDSVLGEK
jgi:hypothetical protein